MESHNLEHKSSLQARPKIKRIVCSGGGAKGATYAGAYAAMEDTGLLPQVQEVAGASVGAITALFMALGISSKQLRELMLETEFTALLGKRANRKNKGVSFITRDGKPLEDFIRQNILKLLRAKLQKYSSQDPRFIELKNKISGPGEPLVTFNDLNILIELFPENFKNLVVNAVNYRTGKMQIFDTRRTGEVEIALACRASASLPIILQPVKIRIDGREELFVDGGLYDNHPTAYFDNFANPQETLVFAFGEGINPKRNQLHQALYGTRKDEVADYNDIEPIIRQAYIRSQSRWQKAVSTKQKFNILLKETEAIIKDLRKNKTLSKSYAKKLGTALKKTFKTLGTKPEAGLYFTQWENELNSLLNLVKEKLKTSIYHPSYLESFKRDYLVNKLAKVKTDYKNTSRKEIGYHRLQADYSLRTVELHVSNLKTTDFKKAKKASRVLAALGYLDSMNYQINHDLQECAFNTKDFYKDFVNNFMHIYQAVLAGSGQYDQNDKFVKLIQDTFLKRKAEGATAEAIGRELQHLIKDKAESNINSVHAFAMSRALEYTTHQIDAASLFKETYENAFTQQGFFSRSKLSGETIYRSSTLRQKLSQQNMFTLFSKNQTSGQRSTAVFNALSKLRSFKQAYEDYKENEPQGPECHR